jgi:NAD(P)-dependent dehydrogenase (short-subunit alcohol dehydrogenase family)
MTGRADPVYTGEPMATAASAVPGGSVDLALEGCTVIVTAFGRIDGLVNNAAMCQHRPLREWGADGFDEQVATNIRAPYFLIQAALPALRQSAIKSVVNISSSSGTLRLSPVSSFMTGAVIPLDGGQVIPHA